MVGRRERVIGTLIVWVAVAIALVTTVGRFDWIYVYPNSLWFNPIGVVTGAASEDVGQLLSSLSTFTSELYTQMSQTAQMELLLYTHYILVVSAVLLLGGVLSTMFIWRSVIVPSTWSEKLSREKEQIEHQNRAVTVRLDDDGELIHTEIEPQSRQNHR
jgi:hypothetical protein